MNSINTSIKYYLGEHEESFIASKVDCKGQFIGPVRLNTYGRRNEIEVTRVSDSGSKNKITVWFTLDGIQYSTTIGFIELFDFAIQTAFSTWQ